MARRSNLRISIFINVKYYCSEKEYSGTATNISEKGMFIATNEITVPENPRFDLAIPLEETVARIPVKVNRLVQMPGGHYGLGVELLNPPQKYIEYVENLMMLM